MKKLIKLSLIFFAKSLCMEEKEADIVVPADVPTEFKKEIIKIIEEVEPYTQSTIIDLIKDQLKLGRPYIVAKVISKKTEDPDNVETTSHYMDAHNLNFHLFNRRYPLSDDLSIDIKALQNVYRMPMVNVQYFALYGDHESNFYYLCSFNDLVNSQYWQNFFYKNLNDPELHYKMAAKNLFNENYKLSREYSELAAQQDANLEIKTKAYELLSYFYILGKGVDRNLQLGFYYISNARELAKKLGNADLINSVNQKYVLSKNMLKSEENKSCVIM